MFYKIRYAIARLIFPECGRGAWRVAEEKRTNYYFRLLNDGVKCRECGCLTLEPKQRKLGEAARYCRMCMYGFYVRGE